MAKTIISLSSLDGNNGFRLDGVDEWDFSGMSVSTAGDVNGDGFDDVVIGSPRNNSSTGFTYVLFGKASGFNPKSDLSFLRGDNGFRFEGGGFLGVSVSPAGDVNGDGFDDVIIGANWDHSSYVVFGKASGFDDAMNLSTLNGNNGFRLGGSGLPVSGAGDVNGDGFDDVVIGALGGGVSYVVFGKASGFDAAMNLSDLNGNNGFRFDGLGDSVSSAGDINGDGFSDLIFGTQGVSSIVFGKAGGFDATLDISSLDGSNGFLLNSTRNDNAGFSVSEAGDFNGDGLDDLIVGAPYGPYGISPGSAYVVFGKDTDFATTMDLSSLDGNNGFRLDGVEEENLLGYSVSDAGDVNGDGFDDLIVGAPGALEGTGSSYVVFGKATGFNAVLDLSHLDSDSGFRIDGVATYGFMGKSVDTAGDVNGDGYDDIVIGAYKADPQGKYFAGSSYVVFGRSEFTGGNVIEGTPGDEILKGTPDADIFEPRDGNDRMIGRGGADVFYGDAGNDYIQVLDLDFGSIDGGIGDDVVHLDGKDLNLDLTDYLDKIQGIETICLYGRGNNTLTLTATELLGLDFITNTLKVHGNSGDRVILEGNWNDGGIHGFYHTFTQDEAILLVGINMTAVFA